MPWWFGQELSGFWTMMIGYPGRYRLFVTAPIGVYGNGNEATASIYVVDVLCFTETDKNLTGRLSRRSAKHVVRCKTRYWTVVTFQMLLYTRNHPFGSKEVMPWWQSTTTPLVSVRRLTCSTRDCLTDILSIGTFTEVGQELFEYNVNEDNGEDSLPPTPTLRSCFHDDSQQLRRRCSLSE